jgi:hypothetical protein
MIECRTQVVVAQNVVEGTQGTHHQPTQEPMRALSKSGVSIYGHPPKIQLHSPYIQSKFTQYINH